MKKNSIFRYHTVVSPHEKSSRLSTLILVALAVTTVWAVLWTNSDTAARRANAAEKKTEEGFVVVRKALPATHLAQAKPEAETPTPRAPIVETPKDAPARRATPLTETFPGGGGKSARPVR